MLGAPRAEGVIAVSDEEPEPPPPAPTQAQRSDASPTDAANGTDGCPRVLQVALHFDSTGSMMPCIAEMKRNVSSFLSELSFRFSDIVIRTRVSANGDYQDNDVAGSYLFRGQDTWTSTSASCDFLLSIGPTHGYDFAEAYEYALTEISHYSWMAEAAKALIFIGDAVPHSPGYILNTGNLDWKDAVGTLVKKGVVCYGVQCLEHAGYDHGASAFWASFADLSGGRHLHLDQLRDAKATIVAILAYISQRSLLGSQDGGNDSAALRVAEQLRRGPDPDAGGGRGVVRPISVGDGVAPASRFQSFLVENVCSVREFVGAMGITFTPGRGYYELSKSEKLASTKDVVVREVDARSGGFVVLEGNSARRRLGLPVGGARDVRISIRDVPDHCKVFVQSTSYNRRLMARTEFLYEVPSVSMM
jgi:hypothetical protein